MIGFTDETKSEIKTNLNTGGYRYADLCIVFQRFKPYSIETKDKKEGIKKAKEYAELHNIKAYLVINNRADVIAVVDENDGK